MSREEALLLRADLLQIAKGLELQRAGVLSMISRIEKEHNIEKGEKNGRNITRPKTASIDNQAESREDTKSTSGTVL